jgi:hypothetical protein
MGIRSITSGERTLLPSVFEETLPYGTLRVAPNDSNTGGVDNSITPGAVPFISPIIWVRRLQRQEHQRLNKVHFHPRIHPCLAVLSRRN